MSSEVHGAGGGVTSFVFCCSECAGAHGSAAGFAAPAPDPAPPAWPVDDPDSAWSQGPAPPLDSGIPDGPVTVE